MRNNIYETTIYEHSLACVQCWTSQVALRPQYCLWLWPYGYKSYKTWALPMWSRVSAISVPYGRLAYDTSCLRQPSKSIVFGYNLLIQSITDLTNSSPDGTVMGSVLRRPYETSTQVRQTKVELDFPNLDEY
jgi:hypothetical protein